MAEIDAAACLFDVDDEWSSWRDVELTATEQARLEQYLRDRELGLHTIDRFWGGARFDDVDRARPGRLVTLFSNLTWDSAVIGQGLAFEGIAEWVTATVEFFADRPDDQLVIRVHPAEVKLPGKQTREPLEPILRRRFPELPPNVRLVPADDPESSYPLMAASDAVLVFTSTTGLEAAVRGRPVIVAGRTHYRERGFTVDVEDRAHTNARSARARRPREVPTRPCTGRALRLHVLLPPPHSRAVGRGARPRPGADHRPTTRPGSAGRRPRARPDLRPGTRRGTAFIARLLLILLRGRVSSARRSSIRSEPRPHHADLHARRVLEGWDDACKRWRSAFLSSRLPDIDKAGKRLSIHGTQVSGHVRRCRSRGSRPRTPSARRRAADTDRS